MTNEEATPVETAPPTMDKTTLALFDLEMRIVMSCDNLNLAEKLLNELRELSKIRKLQRKDFQQFESLLFVIKEYFEVATCDLMDELYSAIKEQKDALSVTKLL